jgi:hypothetical protein
MRRFVLATALALTATLGAASGASAGDTLLETIQVQPNPVEGGAEATVIGTNWNCGVPVRLLLFGPSLNPLGEVIVEDLELDGQGFEYTFEVPELPGLYEVRAEYMGECQRQAVAGFNVIAPTTVAPTLPPSTPAPTTAAPETTTTAVDLLPPTGTSSTGPLVLVAMLLVGVGLVLVTRSRSVSQV